jgi:hypothetical protein
MIVQSYPLDKKKGGEKGENPWVFWVTKNQKCERNGSRFYAMGTTGWILVPLTVSTPGVVGFS